MYITLYLLTATWAAGAPAAASSYSPYTYTTPQPLPQGVQQYAQPDRLAPSATPDPAPAPTRFRDRIRHLFSSHHADHADPAVTPTAGYGVQSGKAWRQTPADLPPGLRSLQTRFQLSKDELEKVGHEKDYSWITGKLFHVPDGASRWVVRYAGPYEVDRYDGMVLLAPTPELGKFHDGDMVCVHGKVTHAPSPKPLAGATYQVESINVIGQPGR